MSDLTPKQIVSELDRYIIGQVEAKKAVAVALRNRWRRMQLDQELRAEVTPKNILMIGPTGVGKTEIARRLSKLANAPFVKVEASKFTEVGYVGKDVESIVRDLADIAVKMQREQEKEKVKERAQEAVENRILDAFVPQPSSRRQPGFANEPAEENSQQEDKESSARQSFRRKLRNGELEDKEIEIEVAAASKNMEIIGPPGMEEMTSQLSNMFSSMSGDKKHKRRLKVAAARKVLEDEEANKLIDEEEIKLQALEKVEQNGIVFVDEIDKVCKRAGGEGGGGEVSREGVQRDLLPLIEGSTISTKYGMVKTDHILFIASGAFHVAHPSDMIPELQGRLPIRVELRPLSIEDFVSILVEPDASIVKQYIALMGTEEVNVTFSDEAIRRIAEISWQVNDEVENIGARRLHTVMERLFEDLSYEASDLAGEPQEITREYVDRKLGDLVKDQDLSRYIL